MWSILGVLLLCSGASAGIRPVDLRCEYLHNPIGLDEAHPRLGWKLVGDGPAERGQRQTAYRVLVSSTAEKLSRLEGDLWDSGRVDSDRQLHIEYAGKPLASRSECHWAVQVWDEAGKASGWSQPARWTMGLLEANQWEAEWIMTRPQEQWEKQRKDRIAAEKEANLNFTEGDPWEWYLVHRPHTDPAPLFRREFKIDREVAQATVYVTGLGYYELYLNGSKVGNHVLDPGWTDYTKRVLYEVYDVTASLRRGANAVGVMVGRGFYNQLHPYYQMRDTQWTGQPKTMVQLEVDYRDGTRQTIVTDSTWKTAFGPIVYDGPRVGEIHDAREEKPGWTAPGYDDARWRQVVIGPKPAGVLQRQMIEPIRVRTTLTPVKTSQPKPGVFVYDLGQNIAGWPRLKFSGAVPAGRKIKIRVNDGLEPDGTVSKRMYSYWPQEYTWISNGVAGGVFEPRFRYSGFRYVQVEGVPGNPGDLEVFGQHVCTDLTSTGEFACSNEMINRIQRNLRWTLLNNMHSIPEDCPNREKRGWTGDSQLTCEAVMFNFQSPQFFTKYLGDLQDAQHTTGVVPRYAPYGNYRVSSQDAPAWSGAYLMNAWNMYQYYGDDRLLRRHFESFKRYVDSIERTPGIGGVGAPRIIGGGHGDWLAPDVRGRGPEGQQMVETSYYFHCAELLSRMAEVLGRGEESARYRALAEEIRQAINKEFFDAKGSLYRSDKPTDYRQTLSAVALYLQIVPEEHVQAVLDRLVREIVVTKRNHLDTGFVGTKALMEILPLLGRADVAYAVASQTTFPSWIWAVLTYGATTIPEHWYGNIQQDPGRGSRNHPPFGSVSSYYFKHIAGLRPDPAGPGFQRFILQPMPTGDLTWARASYESVRGTISIDWKLQDGRLRVDVEVPVNCRATLHLPGSGSAAVTESGKPVDQARGVRFLPQQSGAGAYEVGSGRYVFETALSAPAPRT